MKRFIAKYLLYIYVNFIKDDSIDYFKKWAQPIMRPFIFIRKIYIWMISIIFFPIFVIGMIFENDKRVLEIKKIYLNNSLKIEEVIDNFQSGHL